MDDTEIINIIIKQREEYQRYLGVSQEEIKDQIQIVAEQVASNTVKLVEHSQCFEKMQNDLDIVKTDLVLIKNKLSRKVDYDEFAALEKRVNSMEIKLNKAI